MLKSASRALVVTTVQTTKRLINFIGRPPQRSFVPPAQLPHHTPYTRGSQHDIASFSPHELQALFEPGTFEDRLLSAIIWRAKPLHFTPLQLMLLLIMCSGLLKKIFSRRQKDMFDVDALNAEETILKTLLDLVSEEIERIYQLTSARNALVSPDPR